MLATNSSQPFENIKLHGAPHACAGLHLRGAFNENNELIRVAVLEWNLSIVRDDGESPEGFHDRLCRMLAEAAE